MILFISNMIKGASIWKTGLNIHSVVNENKSQVKVGDLFPLTIGLNHCFFRPTFTNKTDKKNFEKFLYLMAFLRNFWLHTFFLFFYCLFFGLCLGGFAVGGVLCFFGGGGVDNFILFYKKKIITFLPSIKNQVVFHQKKYIFSIQI